MTKGQAPGPRVRIMLWLYAVIWTLGLPLILLYLRKRAKGDALYGQHLSERFGRHQSGFYGCVWVHAVSLGEMRSAVPLIRLLLAEGEQVVCTHFTPAGRRETERVFADEIAAGHVRAVWVPFEFGWAFRRFFKAFRPKYGLVMEIEIWPRMIFSAQKADIPLFMCNAQYPSKSMVRDAKWVGLGLRHAMMRGFAGAFVKSELQARRFASVGVRNIHVTGELRFDQPVPEPLVVAGKVVRQRLTGGRRVITVASAIEGEDALYLAGMKQALEMSEDRPFFVYVPRAPERFEAVAEMLGDAGFRVARRSDILSEAFALVSVPEIDVLLGDSLGEMYGYLAMADQVVTGGGFHPKGAHNIIEPLALRKPVIVGPYVHTIEYPYVEAEAAGVCLGVETAEALNAALCGDWQGPSQPQIETFFATHSGGAGRTLAAIKRVVV